MSIGSPFHPRTAPLNRKQQWREWSGYLAASAYDDSHLHEYTAIREAAALIDVSPLFKYRVSGPQAQQFVDRVITRDARKLGVGSVWYTPWCDEAGKVVDDGTVARLDESSYRWTAAEPQLRWLRQNATGLDVDVEDISEAVASIALQGPLARTVLEAATGADASDLRFFRRRAAKVGRLKVDVSRTGYTGDLGYELWIDARRAAELWDALASAGAPFGIRAAGMLALDIVRIEAGFLLLDVDYTSSRAAVVPEQSYSPFEIGLGRLVDLEKGPFVGRSALRAEQQAGGPPRRLVGLTLGWSDVERLYAAQGLPPSVPAAASRTPVPLFEPGGRQVGRVTSTTWSPLLKQLIALASVEAGLAEPGTRLAVEWTVEAHRGRVGATVVPLPFFDPPRKRA